MTCGTISGVCTNKCDNNNDALLNNNANATNTDCLDCLLQNNSYVGIICCDGSSYDKLCKPLLERQQENQNTQSKNETDQYNNIVNTYNLFNDVLDVQTKTSDKKWNTTRSSLEEMDEIANNIMTKSRIIQLAEEEHERSKVSMNRLLWFFVMLIIIAVLVFAHSYGGISSQILLWSTVSLFVVYLFYFFISEYLHKRGFDINKLEKSTKKILEETNKAIAGDDKLSDIRKEVSKWVNTKCCPTPSTSSTTTTPNPKSPLPSYQSEADVYFDGSAPVQQIYPRISDSESNYKVKFNTQVDYGQRDSCENTNNPMWKSSGLPKMSTAYSVPTGVNAPMCKSPDEVRIQGGINNQCTPPKYTVPAFFGGNKTI